MTVTKFRGLASVLGKFDRKSHSHRITIHRSLSVITQPQALEESDDVPTKIITYAGKDRVGSLYCQLCGVYRFCAAEAIAPRLFAAKQNGRDHLEAQ